MEKMGLDDGLVQEQRVLEIRTQNKYCIIAMLLPAD